MPLVAGFLGEGDDGILRIAFGVPGLGLKPGTKVPTGPGLSKAPAPSGEQVMRRASGLDAARTDVELGIGATWHGMETTSFDGTTAELFSNDVLADAFGVPAGARNPRSASSRTSGPDPAAGSGPPSAATTTGRTPWSMPSPRRCGRACSPSPTAVFPPMDRWIRFSATGSAPAPAGQNGGCRALVPFKMLKTLLDGSELVILH